MFSAKTFMLARVFSANAAWFALTDFSDELGLEELSSEQAVKAIEPQIKPAERKILQCLHDFTLG